jgi:hypothetical protein
MLSGGSEGAQSRGVGGVSSGFRIEFLPKAAQILGFVIYNREHAAQEEQAAGL